MRARSWSIFSQRWTYLWYSKAINFLIFLQVWNDLLILLIIRDRPITRFYCTCFNVLLLSLIINNNRISWCKELVYLNRRSIVRWSQLLWEKVILIWGWWNLLSSTICSCIIIFGLIKSCLSLIGKQNVRTLIKTHIDHLLGWYIFAISLYHVLALVWISGIYNLSCVTRI